MLDLSGLPEKPVSRLAPTPSGYLHLGNAVNFIIAWVLVKSRDGHLHLRIDDMDGTRFRPDILEDIFKSLDWLGLDWDEGPTGPTDFKARFSLRDRKERYRDALNALNNRSRKVFACVCSRKAIKKRSPSGLYPKTCRTAGHRFDPGKSCLRLQVPDGTRLRVNDRLIDLATVFGDFILWRKDDQPSYQLASVLEDERAGINLVVRGDDLLLSTAAQLYLAGLFGFFAFPRACFVHHDLIRGEDGQKLSKSRGAYALKDLREAGLAPGGAVRAAAQALGIEPGHIKTPEDLLKRMD